MYLLRLEGDPNDIVKRLTLNNLEKMWTKDSREERGQLAMLAVHECILVILDLVLKGLVRLSGTIIMFLFLSPNSIVVPGFNGMGASEIKGTRGISTKCLSLKNPLAG